MKCRGKYHFHQLFCHTLSPLSLALSFHGNSANLSFAFDETAASKDHDRMTLSGPSRMDACITWHNTKAPVLHKAAMMDTMSPSLFRINGEDEMSCLSGNMPRRRWLPLR